MQQESWADVCFKGDVSRNMSELCESLVLVGTLPGDQHKAHADEKTNLRAPMSC